LPELQESAGDHCKTDLYETNLPLPKRYSNTADALHVVEHTRKAPQKN